VLQVAPPLPINIFKSIITKLTTPPDHDIQKHREYAAATFRKDKRINIRISSRDLQALKKRALSEGIPYQTLIASVLHKYVDDRLVDREYLTR